GGNQAAWESSRADLRYEARESRREMSVSFCET
ncbi:hypothetical protein Tco_0584584, partial [Tanacetum coccineum]